MPIIASQLVAAVETQGSEEANAKLLSVGATSDSVGGKIGTHLKEAAMIGAGAFIALGATSLKMAGDFQEGMTSLVTGAGESEKNIKMVSDAILDMSVKTGTSTEQLTAGMYMIESAGFHGAAGLAVLKAAAEGARVGNADLGVVADGVTTIMTDYAKSGITAAQATNTLVATVAAGKTHMADLAASLAMILPTASAVGVHLNDVAAAMATMTAEGVPAADAATYLRQTLMSMENPGTKAKTVLKEIGLTADEIATDMKRSLPDTLQLIEDHLSKKFPQGSSAYVDALASIAGGTKTMQGLLDLTGQHLQTFKDNVTGVSSAVEQGGTQITGWTKVQGDMNFQLDQAHQALDAVFIKIGTDLFPMVSKFLSDDVMPAIQHFSDWATNTHGLHDAFQEVVTVGGDLIGVVEHLVSGIGNFVQGVQQGDPWVATLAGGLTAIGTAIGLIKIEEWAAGWYNTFQQMQQANGIIAGMAARELPNLGRALGWTQRAAQDTAVSVESIGAAAVTAEAEATSTEAGWIDYFGQITEEAGATGLAVESIGTKAGVAEGEAATAAAGMTAAFALATGAISLSFGILVAAWITTQQDITTGAQKMSADVQKAYDDLGNSAADNAAKAQITQMQSADNVASEANVSAGKSRGYWVSSYYQTEQASKQAKEQMIADQAKIADAAVAAAQKADGAWVKASQDMSIVALLQQAGWTGPEIQKYLAGTGTNTNPVSVNTGPTLGQHHASGILNNPVGHWATVGEQGPEVMYVPQGASIFPHGSTPDMSSAPGSGNGGQPTPVYLQIDGQTFARLLMPYHAGTLRSGLGIVGV